MLGNLVEKGLVEKQPRIGYAVKQPNMEEILELYDVRLALELYAVEWLAKNGMPQPQWEELHTTWNEILSQANPERFDFTREDEKFHETLVLSTGNRTLSQQHKNVDERLQFVRMMDITSSERLRATCQQHLQILTSIRNGDVAGAREAVQINIEDGRNNVDQAIKEALAKTYLQSKGSA